MLNLQDLDLSLFEYQRIAKEFAMFPEEYRIIYPAFGLVGEAGEVAEKIKKHLRTDGDPQRLSEVDAEELAKELGDVLWYLAVLADALGYDLDYIAYKNLDKLADRAERSVIHGDGDNR